MHVEFNYLFFLVSYEQPTNNFAYFKSFLD